MTTFTHKMFQGIRDTGLKLDEPEARKMFSAFDKDNSGSVNIDEFLISVRVRENALML